MPTKMNRTPYNIATATCICNNASPDGDDNLSPAPDGRFFLEEMACRVDGVTLRPDQCPEDVAPELGMHNLTIPAETIMQNRRARLKWTKSTRPLTRRQALRWCIQTQIPECFRSRLLASIRRSASAVGAA